MKKKREEQSLVPVNEKNIFSKIKRFFGKIFHKREENTLNEEVLQVVKTDRESFIESIKDIGREERELLELQKKYTDGKIKLNDLTKEQIDSLSTLYIKQTEDLRKSNERRRKRIEEHKQYQKRD